MLVQVRADPSNKSTLGRELGALAAAGEEHPHATRRLLVLDRDSVPRLETQDVRARPIYEWLLAARDEDRTAKAGQAHGDRRQAEVKAALGDKAGEGERLGGGS